MEALLLPVVLVLLGIIGYLFQQNVVAMRLQTAQLAEVVSRLQEAVSAQAAQQATLTAKQDALEHHLERLEDG